MATILPNPPSVVEYGTRRFLIFDAPNDDNLDLYIREFKKRNIVHVVRACEPTYDAERLKHAGIDVTDVMFQDGGSPPKDVVDKWRSVCRSVFKRTDEPMIGVHCVAGLGRAPVLVAIALIEEGMDPLDAVEYIRQYRRGAINTNQLRWLRNYKKSGGGGCSLM